MSSYLSLYDVSGIQGYVFASNRLRENLGGSCLVKQVLEDSWQKEDSWLRDAVAEVAAKTGKSGAVLWAGGGNATVRWDDLDAARETATRLSWRLVRDASGLALNCAHVEETGGYHETYERARRLLERTKEGRAPDAAFDGLGVTAACRSTCEPASAWRDPLAEGESGYFVGPAAEARLGVISPDIEIKRILEGTLTEERRQFAWPVDLDDLGRTRGERSFVGVIHFDGNGIGERFRKASKAESAVKSLSAGVKAAGVVTLQRTMAWVQACITDRAIGDPKAGGFALPKGKGQTYWPVRPIVFGGDDVTIVCDGRIALDLAARLLEEWNAATAALPGGAAHACAGVALVKSHYPFFRAYRIADDLCQSAKRWLRRSGVDGSAIDGSALDWEMVRGGGVEGLAPRRETAKAADGNALHARPYLVVGEPPPTLAHRQWKWFRDTLLTRLQEQGIEDESFHTQYKGLAAVLHEGREATREHLRRWQDRFQRSLPSPPGVALVDGFAGGGPAETPYLDALELMDFVVPGKYLKADAQVAAK